MVYRLIPAKRATSTLTRLTCCAELLVGIAEELQAEGASPSSSLRLSGTCDLLEVIIRDFCEDVEAAVRITAP